MAWTIAESKMIHEALHRFGDEMRVAGFDVHIQLRTPDDAFDCYMFDTGQFMRDLGPLCPDHAEDTSAPTT